MAYISLYVSWGVNRMIHVPYIFLAAFNLHFIIVSSLTRRRCLFSCLTILIVHGSR